MEESPLSKALERQKSLQRHFLEVRRRIEEEFSHLTEIVENRREIVLRQFEALARQQMNFLQSQSTEAKSNVVAENLGIIVEFANGDKLKESLSSFGRIECERSHGVYEVEPCKLEEYKDTDVHFDKEIALVGEKTSDRAIWEKTNFDLENVKIDLPRIEKCFSNDSNIDARVSNDNKCKKECFSADGNTINVTNAVDNHEGDKNITIISNTSKLTKTTSVETQKFGAKCSSAENNENTQTIASNDRISDDNFVINRCIDEISASAELKTQTDTDLTVEQTHSRTNTERNTVADTDSKQNININTDSVVTPSREIDERRNLVSNTDSKGENLNHDRNEHPEQVRQWLEQILRETDLEPSINKAKEINLPQVLIN